MSHGMESLTPKQPKHATTPPAMVCTKGCMTYTPKRYLSSSKVSRVPGVCDAFCLPSSLSAAETTCRLRSWSSRMRSSTVP